MFDVVNECVVKVCIFFNSRPMTSGCYTGALKVLISLNSDLCQSSPSSAPSTESSSECSRRSSESSSPNDSICEKNNPMVTAVWVDCESKSGTEVARL